jgi:predicted nucleotidyltransferase
MYVSLEKDNNVKMIQSNQILGKITETINQINPDSEIILYGSRARGDFNRFSDWDVLILLNRSSISFELEIQYLNQIYEIELESGEIISPLIYTKNDWIENHSITPFFENIKKEGIKIK